MSRSVLLPLLCTALGACQPVGSKTYEGPLLGTVSGQISLETPVDGPYRLAVAWTVDPQPESFGGEIEAQDEDYSADSIHYSMDIHQPPPENALGPLMSNGGLVAVGQLVAYQDLNGNEKLDRIPPDGHPIDRVLGLSGAQYQIAFAERDGTINEGTPVSLTLHKGINVVRQLIYGFVPGGISGELVDSIPLTFNDYAWNNQFLCSGDGTPYVCLCDSPSELLVQGQLTIDTTQGASGGVETYTYDGLSTSTQVAINGQPLPFAPPDGLYAYFLQDPTLSVIHIGTNTLTASLPGHDSVTQTFDVNPLALNTPAAGSVLPASQDVVVSWTAVPGADEYLVGFAPDLAQTGSGPGLVGLGVLLLVNPTKDNTFVLPHDQLTAGTGVISVSTQVGVSSATTSLGVFLQASIPVTVTP